MSFTNNMQYNTVFFHVVLFGKLIIKFDIGIHIVYDDVDLY